MPTVFTRIIDGEIPGTFVWRDDRCVVFLSINPISPGHARLVFGDLEIIPDEGKVTRSGVELHLTKTEFRLLCELAQNPGRVFSRESLLDKVWGYDYFGDGRLVDVHVRRLRTKVETDAANPRHVVTVRGLGYRLQS